MMTFTEARKFMDENASFERRVGFQVFNERLNRWEDFGDSYHGGRKVYDKRGNLNIIDPDYRSMWSPWNCGWYIWEVSQGRRLIISLGTKEKAEEMCKKLRSDGLRFVVEESDVHDDTATGTIR